MRPSLLKNSTNPRKNKNVIEDIKTGRVIINAKIDHRNIRALHIESIPTDVDLHKIKKFDEIKKSIRIHADKINKKLLLYNC